jgi:Fe-S-cluster containining protein
MSKLFNIPKHTTCINCQRCCGIIPATEKEVDTIRDYIIDHPEIINRIMIEPDGINCPFCDTKAKRCIIYPVRPIICQLFGVAENCVCPNGNSANINGRVFIDTSSEILLLNTVVW